MAAGGSLLEEEAPLAESLANRFDPATEVWARLALKTRLQVLRRARVLIAQRAESFADVISSELERSRADTLVAEVLPLLAAIKYLERHAERVLAGRRAGVSGRPMWLGRVTSEIERVPVGRVLVIAVSNYPLLLPGVQAVQALAAGNTVIWKPGRGGAMVAGMFARTLTEAGLPKDVLTVTDESVAAAYTSMDSGVDKLFFTGSAMGGREVMHYAANLALPCVMEMSGADAVIVLPSASIEYAVRAIGFGLRLNGSATCMAPRRVLLVDADADRRAALLEQMWREMRVTGPMRVPETQTRLAVELLDEARAQGATVLGGELNADGRFGPALVLDGEATMRVAQTDVFAPVLTVIDVHGTAGVEAAQKACPLALTASIFGDVEEARALAKRLKVGHVSINDLVVPTADPRVPFAGRKQSGFGVTRGPEGLLEMTVPRVIAVRRGESARRYERTGAAHVGLFAGLAALLYGGTVLVRMRGAKQTMVSARAVSQGSAMKNSGDA